MNLTTDDYSEVVVYNLLTACLGVVGGNEGEYIWN
jgi:hypothetical protein